MKRNGMLLGLLLLLTAAVLSGCAGAVPFAQPTGSPFVDRLLAFLASPNVAYLLFVFGLLAIIAEITTPGATAPGVAGAIMLILSLFGLLQLPTNWLGPVLIVAGIVMLLLDIKVTGFALSVGGLIAFALGSLLIFTPPWVRLGSGAAPVSTVNPWLVVAMTVGVALFFIFGIAAVVKAQRRPVAVGRETMIGKVGVARGELNPGGFVRLDGEDWSADNVTNEEIPAGTKVRVVAIEGLRLKVERDWGAARWSERTPLPPEPPEL